MSSLLLRTARIDLASCMIVFPGIEPIPEEVIEADPVRWLNVLQTIDTQISFDRWMLRLAVRS